MLKFKDCDVHKFSYPGDDCPFCIYANRRYKEAGCIGAAQSAPSDDDINKAGLDAIDNIDAMSRPSAIKETLELERKYIYEANPVVRKLREAELEIERLRKEVRRERRTKNELLDGWDKHGEMRHDQIKKLSDENERLRAEFAEFRRS